MEEGAMRSPRATCHAGVARDFAAHPSSQRAINLLKPEAFASGFFVSIHPVRAGCRREEVRGLAP